MKQTKSFHPRHIEVVFNVLYLMTDLVVGLYFLSTATSPSRLMFGVMALVLGGGDAFHLVPRIRSALANDKQRFIQSLGRGKMITSITMTIFYVLLWHTGQMIYGLQLPTWTAIVYLLAILRIGLCLSIKNGWTTESESMHWNIYRNIPFFLLGGLVMVLFLMHASNLPYLRWMWLAITVSFGFYLPVVLFVDNNPKLGMLMLPKSCAYVWILLMGLGL